MAGSGQMEEELRQMAKDLQVEKEVIFYGFQSPAAVRDGWNRVTLWCSQVIIWRAGEPW